MRWAVEVQSTGLDRRNLADLLDGLGFDLVDGVESPAFTSRAIDDCEAAADAYEIAKGVRDAFTGPARIDPGFELGSVLDYSSAPPKRHAFVEAKAVGLSCVAGKASVSVTPPKGLSGAELEKWEAERAEREYREKLERQRSVLEPAFRSPRAVKMLELLASEEPSGETLNKIYEIAEEGSSSRDDFLARYGIAREEFERFGDAVHNPTVSGDWARHAYHAPPKSGDPMTRSEAEQFVRRIAAAWLEDVRNSRA